MLRDNVGRFVIAKRQSGCSRGTVEKYGWHLERLAVWLGEHGVESLAGVTRDLLREWGASLYDRWQPATVKQAVTSVRSFLRWCSEEGLVDVDLVGVLRQPRVPKKTQRTVTVEEVRELLDVCDRSTVKGIRDYALIHVLCDTGLRLAEVCALEVSGLRLDERWVSARVKGGDEDYAFFSEYTADALRGWLEVRPAAPGVSALFTSTGGGTVGNALSPRSLRGLVRRIGEKAGVPPISPHCFRRAFACIASNAGAPTRLVMGAGRWSSMDMVIQYTRAIQRREMYEREEWVPMNSVRNGEE